MSSDFAIRPATDADLPAVLALLQTSMGRDDDERFASLFRWKHLDNAFGRSPMWLACDGDVVAGLRVFMRWEFERAGSVVRAVRAVDTATHPDYQGRGIFTLLTRHALERVTEDGVDFVFNTPNDKSRPGYLKMGWRVIGRPQAGVRPTRLAALPALRGARTAANHWSEECHAGVPARAFFADGAAAEAVLRHRSNAERGLRTRLSPEVLEWRFGLDELGYRVVEGEHTDDGVAVVRIRRRGGAREAALVLTLGPSGRARRRLLGVVRRALRSEADYLLAVGAEPGMMRIRGLGPIVTARSAAGTPPERVEDLELTLADLELF